MAKREVERIQVVPKRTYTPEELKKFGELIEKYKENHTLKNGEVVRVLNYDELAVAYGAYVKRPGNGGGFYYLVARHDGPGISRHEQFLNLMDQYDWYVSGVDRRRDYAIKMENQDLEKTAESVINAETDALF